MRTLGTILAGGQSRRFGTDKADAMLAGRTLLAHAVEALRPQGDAIVIVGRNTALAPSVADWPRPAMGPLGGIAGALRYAAANGFDQLLSLPVDSVLPLPDLRHRLEPAPAFAEDQPVIGLWPVAALPALQDMLSHEGRHSMRAFAERIGARPVAGLSPGNINTVEDLRRIETEMGVSYGHGE